MADLARGLTEAYSDGMCASYGLGGARHPLPYGEIILDEKDTDAALRAWVAETGGKANTTRSTNWNPIVMGQDRSVQLAWWWIWKHQAPARFTAFNARDDKLLGREWKEPFQHRGLLPATWYSEGKKIWALPSGEPFFLAAITAPRGVNDDGPKLSYAMVTRAAVGEATSVVTSRGDSRMPLVVPPALHDEWLDPGRAGDEDLIAQVVAASEDLSRSMTAAA